MKSLERRLENKDHVIWDWNGTLLSDLDHALATVNHLLREENLPTIDLDRYRQTFGFPVVEYYRGLGFDCSPEAFAKLCDRFTARFHAGLNACALWPGARELLGAVRASGRTQSLLSLTDHASLVNNVAHFELTPYFHFVVGGSDRLAASKLDRGRHLMELAGHSPARTILVGDTDHDLEVGRALGVDVLLVEHGHQHGARLRALHDDVVRLF